MSNFPTSDWKKGEGMDVTSKDSGLTGVMTSNNNTPSKPLKHKLDSSPSHGEPRKKVAKKSPRSVSAPKNAVCALNEMYRGLNYKLVRQEGPVHQPIFTVAVEVNSTLFEGRGRNKKAARQAAAEAALRSIIQMEDPTESCLNTPVSSDNDFSTDVTIKDLNSFDLVKNSGDTNMIVDSTSNNGVSCNKNIQNLVRQKGNKGAVMLLNELHSPVVYSVVSETGETCNKYTMAVEVDGKRFEGSGPSKKLAKAASARVALSVLHNISFTATLSPKTEHKYPGCQVDSVLPQVLTDHIAKLIIDKFTELMENDPIHIKRKVIAGIVMTEGYDIDSCKIISVSTGTKCINGERMSTNGTVLNDSHAEIISRRCLCDFLYHELEKFVVNTKPADSILELLPNAGGFKVKDNVKFHLFINTAPCGDARIFSPHDEETVDRHPNRKTRGQLRTKIESGEGTIPVKSSDGYQTWDGVIQGERLLTMSCSDKVAKWNVVGLQGALLSNFIQPIYLESIILGSLFHPEHLYRAICGRVESTLQALPPPYKLNKPKMSLISSVNIRQASKAPNYSVNWTVGCSNPEIINSVTGRTDKNVVSRLTKRDLLARFLKLVRKLPTITKLTNQKQIFESMYCDFKEASLDYQLAKKQLYEAFGKAELGSWVKKPMECDQFRYEDDVVTNK